jgi:DNA-binding PadR family transcriptional regulator
MPTLPETELLPLKPVWLHLLLAMASGHCHGYAMRKEVERRTDGRLKIWPPTLYRGLAGLLEAGLVEDDPDGPASQGDRERKLYRITALGRQTLSAELHRLEELVQEARLLDIISGEAGGGV